MSVAAAPQAQAAGGAQRTVRRLIVYVLLFALVAIGATGLSGLVSRLLEAGTALASDDVAGLARSLAFTLIGGPLAALLWWAVWKRLDDQAERSSVAWGLYLAAMYTVSLITFSSALLATALQLIDGDWTPSDFATGLVWAGVWAWHRWMWRHAAKRPVRLATVPIVVGSVYGLVIGVGGAVNALGSLLDTAIRGSADQVSVGQPWWDSPLKALLWAIAGGAIWWWHWIRDDTRRLKSGLANVALVVVGILGAGVLTLGGIGTTLFVLLRLAFDRTNPMGELLDPLGEAIASAAIGALVWYYHRRIAAGRPHDTRQAATLVTSGVGLVAAATGIGIIVNSLLATLSGPLAGADTRTLFLGGISALVVGGPVWWLVWKPVAPVAEADMASTGRRVYLIAVFGLSAIVALVALLVVGYGIFEFALDSASAGSLVEKIRVPLGLLVATALVAGYHFSVWRRDRAVVGAMAPVLGRRISRVFLVTGAGTEAQTQAIEDATGASVTVWLRADAGEEPGTAPDAARLAAALDGVIGKRVLVITGPGDRLDVIPLAD
ncbi:DUF5671 domain-containing protein [Cryobacterium tagatosivorans]|uniref:DUF5671 domain-containing protein n=1 Tax=Cryobacterium tagatosivorans TaxID=1259199 RepID=A0A4V3I6Q7_9MICO|nr:DUF5671 domain-containing protein [Cryobacterium tagatosivorans]TFB53903.1 hypothetical protein E3O23_04215 [Cryobacterium tagatosivorans]